MTTLNFSLLLYYFEGLGSVVLFGKQFTIEVLVNKSLRTTGNNCGELEGKVRGVSAVENTCVWSALFPRFLHISWSPLSHFCVWGLFLAGGGNE